MKGGYQILKLGGVTLNSAVVFPGAYQTIHNSNKKAVMISQLRIGTTDIDDVFVLFSEADGAYHAYIPYANNAMLAITVESNDKVGVSAVDYSAEVSHATTEEWGTVRQMESIEMAEESVEDTYPTVTEFNALVAKYNELVAKLLNAGIMEEPEMSPLESGESYTNFVVAKADRVGDGTKTMAQWVSEVAAAQLTDGLLASTDDEETIVILVPDDQSTPYLLITIGQEGDPDARIILCLPIQIEDTPAGWYTGTSFEDLAPMEQNRIYVNKSGTWSVENGAETLFADINGIIVGTIES